MATKTQYYLQVGTNKYVAIKAFQTAVSGIATELGYQTAADPAQVIGEGRVSALSLGCFPLAIYYTNVVSGKTIKQRAIVLCAPANADTAAQAIKGQTYRGKPIVDVTPVKRRKIVIG